MCISHHLMNGYWLNMRNAIVQFINGKTKRPFRKKKEKKNEWKDLCEPSGDYGHKNLNEPQIRQRVCIACGRGHKRKLSLFPWPRSGFCAPFLPSPGIVIHVQHKNKQTKRQYRPPNTTYKVLYIISGWLPWMPMLTKINHKC